MKKLYFDRKLGQWYEDIIAEEVGVCEECYTKIYDDEEYLTNGKNFWCCQECLYKYYEIKIED